MKHILHIIPDDKFSEKTIDFYSSLDFIKSDYITIKKEPFLYLNKNAVISLPLFSSELRKCVNNSKYDAIVFHSLGIKTMLLIVLFIKKAFVIWRTYGNDLYSLVYNQSRIHRPLTYGYFRKNEKALYFKIVFKNFLYRTLFKIGVKKINIISCHLNEEFDLLQAKYKLKAKKSFLPIGFFPVSKNFNNITNGNNLLIGQSASLWNNHLDIFPLIKSNLNCFETIICPLSYPQLSNAKYKKKVIAEANFYFNDKFKPLIEFLPEEEYNKVLCTFKAAIFYHERQAALANIIICLFLGINVFMSKTNCLYDYLLRIGLNIYAFPEEFTPENINYKINSLQLENCHNILQEHIWLTYDETYLAAKVFFEENL